MNKKVLSIGLSILFCLFLLVFVLFSLILGFFDLRMLIAGDFKLMESPSLYFIAALMRVLFLFFASFAGCFFFLPLLWKKEHRAMSTMVAAAFFVLTPLTFFFYEWFVSLILLLSLLFACGAITLHYFFVYRPSLKEEKQE